MDELKDLLRRAQGGDDAAKEKLFAVAYGELSSLARAQLRGSGYSTLLDTTVLLHESYLRFRNAGELTVTERGQFFSYMAQVMRSVIVDFARQRHTQRRGGHADQASMSAQLAENVRVADVEIIRINEALEALQKLDERMVRIFEMRYFARMTENEVAAVLGVADRIVRRDWKKARLLLMDSLRGDVHSVGGNAGRELAAKRTHIRGRDLEVPVEIWLSGELGKDDERRLRQALQDLLKESDITLAKYDPPIRGSFYQKLQFLGAVGQYSERIIQNLRSAFGAMSTKYQVEAVKDLSLVLEKQENAVIRVDQIIAIKITRKGRVHTLITVLPPSVIAALDKDPALVSRPAELYELLGAANIKQHGQLC